MPKDTLLLLALIVIGILGKSSVTAAAAAILLVMKLVKLDLLFPLLEQRGVEIGLLFLILAVLIPFANGRVPWTEIIKTFTTLPGILAVIGGAVATHLNGKGIDLLDVQPQLIIGMVIGSLIGIVFFGGVPVGPLMAGGITALLLYLIKLCK